MTEKGVNMYRITFILELPDHYGMSYMINGKKYKPGFYTFMYDNVLKFRFNHDYLVITYRLYEPAEHVETDKFYAYQVANLQLQKLW